jgi:hypothetical protein
MDINKPPKIKPSKIETMSTSKVHKHKPKPDKLMLILGIIAGMILLSAIVIFAMSVFNTKNLDQNQVSNLTGCPDANKQHPGHCISSNIKSIELSSGKPIEYKFQILDDKDLLIHPKVELQDCEFLKMECAYYQANQVREAFCSAKNLPSLHS